MFINCNKAIAACDYEKVTIGEGVVVADHACCCD